MKPEGIQWDGTEARAREIGDWSNRSFILNTLSEPPVMFWAGWVLAPGDWAICAKRGYYAVPDAQRLEVE